MWNTDKFVGIQLSVLYWSMMLIPKSYVLIWELVQDYANFPMKKYAKYLSKSFFLYFLLAYISCTGSFIVTIMWLWYIFFSFFISI
jgi:hypothetical protein